MDSIVCPEVKNTCSSSGGDGTQEASVKKVLQLALLCSKKQPSERPTMNDVVKVLLTLIPPQLPIKKSPPHEMWVASKQYHRYLDDYGPAAMMKHKKDLNTYKKDASSETHSSNTTTTTTSSGGHLFVRFEEVISQDTTIVL